MRKEAHGKSSVKITFRWFILLICFSTTAATLRTPHSRPLWPPSVSHRGHVRRRWACPVCRHEATAHLSLASTDSPCSRMGTTVWSRYALVGSACRSTFCLDIFSELAFSFSTVLWRQQAAAAAVHDGSVCPCTVYVSVCVCVLSYLQVLCQAELCVRVFRHLRKSQRVGSHLLPSFTCSFNSCGPAHSPSPGRYITHSCACLHRLLSISVIWETDRQTDSLKQSKLWPAGLIWPAL